MICILLLSECALNQNSKDSFKEEHREAKEIADMHKINFGGIEIADSEYRIGQILL